MVLAYNCKMYLVLAPSNSNPPFKFQCFWTEELQRPVTHPLLPIPIIWRETARPSAVHT